LCGATLPLYWPDDLFRLPPAARNSGHPLSGILLTMRLRLYRDLAGATVASRGSVVALGAFDGLHRGHQGLLGKVRERAAARGCAAAAITFEPLPRAFFSPVPIARLSSVREKLTGMDAAGIELALMLRFDAELTAMSAEDFITRVLVGRMAAREVWVGADFRFGHRRAGDFALLERMGVQYGFTAHTLPPVTVDGERVSSTRIRQLLAAGEFAEATPLLGRPFVIEGHVERGNQLGRTLGYPTANIHLRRRVSPIKGIFAVRIGVGEGPCSWPGVASLGTRPTVNEVVEPLLEAHLFDFAGDLYGRRIAVEFVGKLRDELKFDDLDALIIQMKRDDADARQRLGMNPILIDA
jgi:riboflavin kinase/FMN adenylyltransferase